MPDHDHDQQTLPHSHVDNCPECRLAMECIRACRHYGLESMVKDHFERMHKGYNASMAWEALHSTECNGFTQDDRKAC